MSVPEPAPWPAWAAGVVTTLAQRYAAALQKGSAFRVWLAFSGGVDSTVLLHLAAKAQLPLTALHVNHGWHPDAEIWAWQCQKQAAALGLPCLVYQLEKNQKLLNPEHRARQGRYRWFQSLVQRGDWLLMAHQADDVITGFLLQFLRNQDPCALMPAVRAFAQARLWRPLLGITKNQLTEFAKSQGVPWIEDPSNHDVRYSRNFLRQHWQSVQVYFPGALTAALGFIAKQRAYCQAIKKQSQRHLRQLNACLPLEKFLPLPQLRWPLPRFLALSPVSRWQVLRLACWQLALPPPPQGPWQGFLPNLALGKGSLQWEGGCLYLYRQTLYLSATLPALPMLWQQKLYAPLPLRVRWPQTVHTSLSRSLAMCTWQLEFVPAFGQGLPWRYFRDGLTLRLRKGGERIKTPLGHTALKNWLQQQGVPPWQRPYLPLIFQGEKLLGVVGVGFASDLVCLPEEMGFWPQWQALPVKKLAY